jgi:hypothetical protein
MFNFVKNIFKKKSKYIKIDGLYFKKKSIDYISDIDYDYIKKQLLKIEKKILENNDIDIKNKKIRIKFYISFGNYNYTVFKDLNLFNLDYIGNFEILKWINNDFIYNEILRHYAKDFIDMRNEKVKELVR